jgi:structural maintenance of chromosome 1
VATFLPLTTIQAKSVDDRLRQLEKSARLAIDVIQYPLHNLHDHFHHRQSFSPEPSTYESSLEKAILYVCANTLVCDNLEVARRLCFDQAEKIKGNRNTPVLEITLQAHQTVSRDSRWDGYS